jgi:hypothetical protein
MKIDTTVIKELPLEFTGTGEVRGFFFTQIKRTDKGFIYSVMYHNAVWYEVFKRKTNQFGGISYPKSKSFGVWAWCFGSLDEAQSKLDSL